PDAQQVAAPDLGDVGVAEAALAQLGGDVAGLGGVHPAGDAATAVEVGGDADVVDAGDLGDVLDVVDVLLDGGQRVFLLDPGHAFGHGRERVVLAVVVLGVARQLRDFGLQRLLRGRARRVVLDEFLVGDGLDHAALPADGAQDVVGDVALVVDQRARRGVRRDDRRLRHLERVAHAVVGGMGYIDHHAQRIGAGHGLAAEVAHSGVARAAPFRLAALDVRRGAGAQVVVAGVDQAQVARTARVGGVDAPQVMAQRITVLD